MKKASYNIRWMFVYPPVCAGICLFLSVCVSMHCVVFACDCARVESCTLISILSWGIRHSCWAKSSSQNIKHIVVASEKACSLVLKIWTAAQHWRKVCFSVPEVLNAFYESGSKNKTLNYVFGSCAEKTEELNGPEVINEVCSSDFVDWL